MERLFTMSRALGLSAQTLGGLTLMVMFLVTLTDVTLRFLWRPIPGTWELIAFMGGIAAGLAIPHTSQVNGHPGVDFLVNKMSGRGKDIMNVATRLVAMAFFILLGWSLLSMGLDYRAGKEVSQTMKLPFYPVIFVLAATFLAQAFQFLLDIIKTWVRHV